MSLTRSLALARVARRSGRTFATATEGGDYFAQRAAIRTHAAVLVGSAWVKKAEDAHHEHLEHVKHENGGARPETPAYSYLNKRDKPFPWGMNSLFWNSEAQKDMSVKDE
ncbi:Cytochrome c oxidase subunit 6A, mitochondrial [Ceratobasidium sp. 414]|nr:Cytochrome c oxidase subunit 6A, mitochondrial [Ceratobasidium sp. 414]